MSNLINEASPPFKYGSTHLDFDPQSNVKLQSAWKLLPQNILAPEGIEHDTHCTVRYGIINLNFDKLYEAILANHYDSTLHLQVTGVGMFDTKDGEALHWVVHPEQWLLNLRHQIEQTAQVAPNTFPDYRPHVTIGFLKKGHGAEYVNKIQEQLNTSFMIKPVSFIYAQKTGARHVVPLGPGAAKDYANQVAWDTRNRFLNP